MIDVRSARKANKLPSRNTCWLSAERITTTTKENEKRHPRNMPLRHYKLTLLL